MYALDTNVILDYLNENKSIMINFRKTAKNKTTIIIPSVVDYEVVRGFYHTKNPEKEGIYENMCLNCITVDVNARIWDYAAKIWAKLRKARLAVGDADILIAALCIINGYTLVTHNTKHFEHINDLQRVDWR